MVARSIARAAKKMSKLQIARVVSSRTSLLRRQKFEHDFFHTIAEWGFQYHRTGKIMFVYLELKYLASTTWLTLSYPLLKKLDIFLLKIRCISEKAKHSRDN